MTFFSKKFYESKAFTSSMKFTKLNDIISSPKNNKGQLIGIIIGIFAAVAVVAIVASVIIMKKRNSMMVSSDME